MTTAKKKFLVGYYLKIVFSGENEPLVVVVVCVSGEGRGWVVFYWGEFWLVRETFLPHPSRENPV